jgi:hypothetical protein
VSDTKLKSLMERRNKSAARLRVVTEKGDLYAATSADGRWIKIGFSTRLKDRLRAINLEYEGAPFTLIGSTRSTYRVEQQLHRAMKPFHLIHIGAGKELYPAAPAVRRIVDAVLARPEMERIPLDDMLQFRRWCRAQAALEENKAPARIAHARRIAELVAAEQRFLDRIHARIAAREAARAAA